MRWGPRREEADPLWSGAAVEWVGPRTTIGGMVVGPGDRATVLAAGRYQLRSFVTSTDVHPEPAGVLIQFASGEQADIDRSYVRVVAPDGPLAPEPDASVADWVVERLTVPWEYPLTVSTLVPDGFEAVVRIEHANPGSEGEVEQQTAAALVDLLRPATTTDDDVVFAIWPGWGDLPADKFPGAATIEVPNREYFLLRGPIDAFLHPIDLMGFSDTCRPAIWWPADRAWIVVTEIDFSWTFVAGSDELVGQIVDDARLPAMKTGPQAEAMGRWGQRRLGVPEADAD